MMIFGHAGIGIKALRLLNLDFPVKWVLVGALLPDVLDKALYYSCVAIWGRETMAGTVISCTRSVGHSGVFLVGILLWAVFSGSRAATAVVAGLLTHLALDLMGDPVENMDYSSTAQALLFPFLDRPFRPFTYANMSEHLRSKLHFGYNLIGEMIGIGLIGWELWARRMRHRAQQGVATLLVFAVGIGAAGLAREARANDAQVREQIDVILDQRHPKDTAQTWQGLGPDAPRVIISMLDEEKGTQRRMRLLEGLGWFDTPEAVDYLKKEARDAHEDLLQKSAIRAIGAGQGAKQADFIASFLDDKDAELRFAAADTLRRIQGRAKPEESRKIGQVIDGYLSREKVSWIAARVRGEKPDTSGPLKRVSSTADQMEASLAGNWSGVVVRPIEKPAAGGRALMETSDVRLELTVEGPSSVSGRLKLERKGTAPQVLELKNATGKAGKFNGKLAGLPSGVDPTFEAELRDSPASKVLEIRIPATATFILLRKEAQ